LEPYFLKRDELTIHDGTLMWGMRVVMPNALRKRVLSELHESHPGIVKMKSLARQYFWQPRTDKDIEATAHLCKDCAVLQKNPQKIPPHSWEYPGGPWHRVHLDFSGPFYGAMWPIYVDAYSKYAGVINMKTTTGTDLVREVATLVAQFGLPEQTVSHNGTQTNGEAERFAQILKHANRATDGTTTSLHEQVQRFLFNYRPTAHCTTERASRIII
jgi:hypothetical protein